MENKIPEVHELPQNPEVAKSRFPKKTLGIVLSFFILFILGGVFFLFPNKSGNSLPEQVSRKIREVNAPSPTPTPLPFSELTIPYLRKKTFDGTLNEKEVAYQGSNYTAYLSSFNSEGFKIYGLLTVPSGETPPGGWPAIIFIHGYIPPPEYNTTQKYYDYVDYFARNGIVVYKIDLRGHGNSEGQAGGGYFGADYVTDTLNAYSALQGSDFVNPKKIGLWGHSMAGNIVARSMAAKPEIPAGVIWAGAVYTYEDMRKYGISDSSYRPPQPSVSPELRRNSRQRISALYGDPDLSKPFWHDLAPSSFLGDLKGAIEIHHAQDDDVVSINYSRDLNALLDKTSVPHELFEYSSGGHNLTGGSFGTAMQRSVEFYKKYLTENTN